MTSAARLASKRAYYARHRERVLAAQHTPAYRQRQAALARQHYHDDPAYREHRLAANRVPLDAASVLALARQLAGPVWYGTQCYYPVREDAAGEAVLAYYEGRDPAKAAKVYLAAEAFAARMRLPLADWLE